MKLRILASAMLAICTSATALAGTHVLLPPQSSDMVPALLQARSPGASLAAPGMPAPHVRIERTPVSVSWALPHDSALQPLPQPFARTSREYWIDVSASALQRGIQLPLSAPGAIIRLSPGDAASGRLDPARVRLQLGRQSLSADRASAQIADAAALHAAGMDVPAASMVMRLRPELGAGLATLQAPAASGRYVVHVFEPQSSTSLTARADRGDLLLGQDLHLHVVMQDAGSGVPLTAAGGYLRAPDGSTSTLTYRRQADGSFTADAQPRHVPAAPGLWEIHSFTAGNDSAGQQVRRDTTTVFAAAVPDARLSGIADTARAADQGIDIRLGVTAQNASRFAVSGVLYGRGSDGQMVPAAYAQSAAWLPAGQQTLVLHYDPASLRGISAPYELHDLRLQDQPALGLVERRALAMRFDSP